MPRLRGDPSCARLGPRHRSLSPCAQRAVTKPAGADALSPVNQSSLLTLRGIKSRRISDFYVFGRTILRQDTLSGVPVQIRDLVMERNIPGGSNSATPCGPLGSSPGNASRYLA